MTNPSENLSQRLKGVGISMSASPPMQDLYRDVCALFAGGASDDDARRYLAEYLVDHPDLGIRALLGLNRKAARLPADKGLMALAKVWADRLKRKSIRDLLVEWTHRNHLDVWVSDFVIEWARTGEPPAISDDAARVVGDFRLGKDADPLVFMFASPLCDPAEAAEAFIKKCALVFPPETWVCKGFAERDALRFKAFEEGATDFDIAKAELEDEGWRWVASGKREYNAGVKTRANSVLVSRNRWYEYVTGLLDAASRNPG